MEPWTLLSYKGILKQVGTWFSIYCLHMQFLHAFTFWVCCTLINSKSILHNSLFSHYFVYGIISLHSNSQNIKNTTSLNLLQEITVGPSLSSKKYMFLMYYFHPPTLHKPCMDTKGVTRRIKKKNKAHLFWYGNIEIEKTRFREH